MTIATDRSAVRSIVASPFNDGALVSSGYSDALVALTYDPTAAQPFDELGELTYVGKGPALPSGMSVISRGTLKGLVVVAENVAVRRVKFDGAGGVVDLGAYELDGDLDAIPGAIGVQP